MKIYAAGWALQSPALNFFKRFLRLNTEVKISGIIYPKKIPDDVDGIPVFDFDSAHNIVSTEDIVIDCHRPGVPNDVLHRQLLSFFEERGIALISTADFLSSLIARDSNNLLRFPVDDVTSTDVLELHKQRLPSFAQDMFADLESNRIAQKLDSIARNSDWDKMLTFDQDQTSESMLFEIILEVYQYGFANHFHVLDTPHVFLNALLKLKALHPTEEFRVSIPKPAIDELDTRQEFFRRTLGLFVSEIEAGSTLLSGSTKSVSNTFRTNGEVAPAIFFMRRSIFDYRAIEPLLDKKKHRVLLRQPDTSPSNLIAALFV